MCYENIVYGCKHTNKYYKLKELMCSNPNDYEALLGINTCTKCGPPGKSIIIQK